MGNRTRKLTAIVAALGTVAGLAVTLSFFISPGMARYWLALGGAVLAVSATLGFLSTFTGKNYRR